MGDLGDRMKGYEAVAAQQLMTRCPVIVRVDGRAFHTLTRGMERPFDGRFAGAMEFAAICVAGEMQGFKVGYVQSDEASFLLTDYATLETGSWFGYDHSKVVSLAASAMTAYFATCQGLPAPAMFDARAFNVPFDDVANYFLWRAKDWERNSLQMFCQSIFSHKQLHGKKRADMHEMLHTAGRNWATEVPERFRNGVFLEKLNGGLRSRSDVQPHFADVDTVVGPSIAPTSD